MKTENLKSPVKKSSLELAKPVSDMIPRLLLAGAVLGGGLLLYYLLKKQKKKQPQQQLPPSPKEKTPRMTTSQFINSMTMILLDMACDKLKNYASKVNSKTN